MLYSLQALGVIRVKDSSWKIYQKKKNPLKIYTFLCHCSVVLRGSQEGEYLMYRLCCNILLQ